MTKQVSFQNRIGGYITRGYCGMDEITSTLRRFEEMAKATLDSSDESIRHVIYAVRYMPNEYRKEVEYRFYMQPMTDEVFEQRVVGLKDVRVYALHR